jgi:flagellin-specific chaperone FliS
MLAQLTLANATNDRAVLAEISALIRKVKSGWDQIVSDER